MSSASLIQKLDDTTATIGVVGLGYVGLPLLLRFSEVGYRTIGFDTDPEKITALKAGKSYIDHIPSSAVTRAIGTGMAPTGDFSRAKKADALILCVPTPLTRYRAPDLSFVRSTLDALMPYFRKGQVVSLESTTYPGTTEEEVVPRIERAGFAVGREMFAVYSPEREDPGNLRFNTRTIPKICGGVTPACLKAGIALYAQAVDRVVPVSSTRAAELTKLLENIHRAVNIGLVNEMKLIADKMGIDVHEVIAAAATKPFGFVPYQPGPGLGGHCIPIDPFYLTWKAREYGVHTRFIELAGEINSAMPEWVIGKMSEALNERQKSLKGSHILVLGIAYKKNVGDTRESPAVELMKLLEERGATVRYSDPHVPKFPKMRRHRYDLASVALTPKSLAAPDAVLIATDHDAFDYAMIRTHSRLIVDTRGVFLKPAKNVVKA